MHLGVGPTLLRATQREGFTLLIGFCFHRRQPFAMKPMSKMKATKAGRLAMMRQRYCGERLAALMPSF